MKEYRLAALATEMLREQHRIVPLGCKAGFELSNGKQHYYVITNRDDMLPLYRVCLFIHLLVGTRVLCAKVMEFALSIDDLMSPSLCL